MGDITHEKPVLIQVNKPNTTGMSTKLAFDAVACMEAHVLFVPHACSFAPSPGRFPSQSLKLQAVRGLLYKCPYFCCDNLVW